MIKMVMVRKLFKGSAYLLALAVAALLSLFAGNRGVSDYVLSNKTSGGVSTAFADVPVGAGGSAWSGDTPGGDSSSDGSCGSSADSSGGGVGSCDGGGDGGGDGSVICTELYRQGMMPEYVWRADEEFGRHISATDPDVIVGYYAWAPAVVQRMKTSPIATRFVAAFALPWAKEMAYRRSVVPVGSKWGSIVMSVGVSSCRVIGKAIRTTRLVFKRIV